MSGGFGGAVKLTGESEYRNALKQCTQSLRELSSEQQKVAAQYNASDKSSSALEARQKALNGTLAEQKKVLDNATSAYNAFAAKVQEQVAKHDALQKEYKEEVAELERIRAKSGEASKEFQDQSQKVNGLAKELNTSQNAMNQNQKALGQMKIAMNQAETAVANTSAELKKSGDEAKNASEGFTVFKGVLADLAASAIKSALNGLKNLGSAVVNVGKQAVNSYADYEQLVGGVETLFKDSAGIVEGYANDAYKTAGLSANEYMETVTSFSASLLQSLGGDTAKAAEYGNRAVTDMADNANKMGTDIGMIQNAYQGFAKQNYTMLDNLKLGYGGTKTEMERLIADASKMTDVQKELGIAVKEGDMSFANITNAISVVQQKMGIMGTTAKEASETIQGSTAAMKSAWQNMLTGMADENADFAQLSANFVESVVTAMHNIIPRVTQVIQGLSQTITTMLPQLINEIVPLIQQNLPIIITAVQQALEAIVAVLPTIVDAIAPLIPQIVSMLVSLLPQVIQAGVQILLSLIQGITQALPELIAMLPSIITDTVNTLLDNLDAIVDAGIELIMALIDGIIDALPDLIDKIPMIIDKLIVAITNNLPKLIEAGIILIVKLAEGLIKAIPQLVGKVPQIITSLLNGIANYFSKLFEMGGKLLSQMINGIGSWIGKVGQKMGEVGQAILKKIGEFPAKMLDVGKNLVQGLWNGINNAKDWVIGKIKGFGDSILSGIKSFFGIKSPSRLFRDAVGKNLALGVGEGFADEMSAVSKDMQDSLPTSFDTTVHTSAANGSGAYTFDSMVNAFKDALSQMKIEMDDQEMGTFIDKTVTKLVYN